MRREPTPILGPHKDHVEILCADVEQLAAIQDGTVDRIFCNELWTICRPSRFRKAGEVEEEFLRPNLTEARHAEIADWSGFVQAFDEKNVQALSGYPTFLEDIIWEKEYRKSEWKAIPYRKTITEFLKKDR